jgi:hypothetical protein
VSELSIEAMIELMRDPSPANRQRVADSQEPRPTSAVVRASSAVVGDEPVLSAVEGVSAVEGTRSVVEKPLVEVSEEETSTKDGVSTWDVVKFGHTLGFEGRPSKSLLVTLKLRLDVESGRCRPCEVGATRLPDDSDRMARTSFDGFVYLLACRWLHTPFQPAPWTAEFAACWCGMSTRQAKDARRELVQMKALIHVGDSGLAKLWLPWGVDA